MSSIRRQIEVLVWWLMQACFLPQAGGSSSVVPWSLSGKLGEFVRCQLTANETYSDRNRNMDVLMVAQSPYMWWSTLKSAVHGLSSSLSPLVGGGGGLVWESVGKDYLLSDHFDSKQSRESVDLQLTCHPSPRLTTFAFRSSEFRLLTLMLALTLWVCFLFFLTELPLFWPPIF